MKEHYFVRAYSLSDGKVMETPSSNIYYSGTLQECVYCIDRDAAVYQENPAAVVELTGEGFTRQCKVTYKRFTTNSYVEVLRIDSQ